MAAFAKAFESLVASIAEKRERLLGEWQRRSASLGAYQAAVDAALEEMVEDRIMARIWAHDHTVWKPEPTEITNRLGWLHIAEAMRAQSYRLDALVEAVTADGYTDVLVLGMGGSSLAPEVFSQVFGGQVAGMPSTWPCWTAPILARSWPTPSVSIRPGRCSSSSTKSGGTAETLSFFKYFYNWTADALGAERSRGALCGHHRPWQQAG